MTTGTTVRARSLLERAETQAVATAARARRQSYWSIFLRRSLDRHGVSQTATAEDLGVRSKSVLQRQLDEDHSDSVSIAGVAGMDARVVRDAARELAQLVGCDIAELPKDVGAFGGLRSAALLQREASEAVMATLNALEDGHLTRAEAVPLRKELDELIAAALVIRARCDKAVHEGVASLGEG